MSSRIPSRVCRQIHLFKAGSPYVLELHYIKHRRSYDLGSIYKRFSI